MIKEISLDRLESSLASWESAGYVALICVIACCFVEYLHVARVWHKDGSWWTERGGTTAALLLVAALASELMTQFNTNAVGATVIARQNANAAITEERLLGERRLTAQERWRLERVERAVLPRSLYVDWPALVSALREAHFSPTNIAFDDAPEPTMFAMQLQLAFQSAGSAGGLIRLPKVVGLPVTSTGVTIAIGRDDGPRLAQLLWQRFRIGGGSMPVSLLARTAPQASIPPDKNCLIVGANGWALAQGDGQPGEGKDQYGGADPAPH